MSKEIQTITHSITDLQIISSAIAKSNLFGIKTAEQALVLCLIAQAEGYHPAQAAKDYHIINNKPSLKADAMLARFQQSGGKVEWLAYTDEKVSGTFSHPQGGSITVDWDMDRARRADLLSNPTWRKYPRNMLRARVISEAIRTIFPGVGTVGMYTPEEMQDMDISEKKPAPSFNTAAKKIDGDYLRSLIRVEATARGINLLEEKANLIKIFYILEQKIDSFDDALNSKLVKEEFDNVYAVVLESEVI